MASLEENIARAIADFDNIKDTITELGVEVAQGTDTSEYGKLVRECAEQRAGTLQSENDKLRSENAELQSTIEELNGGIDEIETLIDESGVLE